MILNAPHFKQIVDRERSRRDAVPEHSRDWYEYNNRLLLLEEVKNLLTPFTVTEAAGVDASAREQKLVEDISDKLTKPKVKAKS